MNKFMSFLAGVLSGAVVGAVTALLLAPMSGEDLQTETRERFDELVSDARTAAETKRLQLEAKLAELKSPKPNPVA